LNGEDVPFDEEKGDGFLAKVARFIRS